MKTMLQDRKGMTLMEVVVAMVLMGFIVTAALSFVRQQEMAFTMGSGRMSALQNYRFAAELLERNIRTAGTGITPGQPYLVYADSATLVLNANYATNDSTDGFAIYNDPAAANPEVGSLTRPRRFTLPQTSFAYPDSTFRDGGVTSPAETIILYFALDGSTARTDDYALFRQVNDLAPSVVARNLLREGGQPFFRYQEVVSSDTTAPTTSWIPASVLPLRHQAAMHLSPADTGSSARIDRLRAVEVNFRSTDGETGPLAQDGAIRRLIRMPNAGQMQLRTCGDPPLFSETVSAAQTPGEARIDVAWNRSVDEASGEQDVVRYAIYRRESSSPDWGEPFFSVPAGNASYAFSDGAVIPGTSYQYAVAAQDCTPSMSGLRTSSLVTVSP
jgi:prepilin-type N-terminal cleavage/methylation domain-containing protein